LVDARGNTTADVLASGSYGYGYNGRNRLTVVQNDGVTVGSYVLNALGERVQKTAGGLTIRFDYDEDSRLLSESSGTTNRDYIWMDGMPVGVVDHVGTSTSVNYVHADGLGSPRAVTSSAGTVLWQWAYAGNPFGEKAPLSSTEYSVNLRFPGQYFDAESGLNYNVNRDYEPATGRYIQSDPLGLMAGPSTYAYAMGNPARFADPLGLDVTTVCRTIDDQRVAWLGVKHCAVFVWHWESSGCPPRKTKVIDAQYSIAGGRTPQGAGGQTYSLDRQAFTSGSGEGYDVAPPAAMTQSQWDDAVRNAGDNYNSGEPYDAVNGPNSNTAAHDIISNAGGTPPWIMRAPNYNYSVPSYGEPYN
jgi:RHS repeat-associated protein